MSKVKNKDQVEDQDIDLLDSAQEAINELAEQSEDYREAEAFQSRLIEDGTYLAVCTGYIEFGTQPQEFEGKKRDPEAECMYDFLLFMPGDEGSETETARLSTNRITMKRSEKSTCYNMFKSMNYTGEYSHPAHMLGRCFLLKVETKTSKEGKRKYSHIVPTGFSAPINPVTRKPFKIPEWDHKLVRLFLWNNPKIEHWNSIYINTPEEKAKEGISSNWMQERCLAALDYEGSPLQMLLEGNGETLPNPADAETKEVARPKVTRPKKAK